MKNIIKMMNVTAKDKERKAADKIRSEFYAGVPEGKQDRPELPADCLETSIEEQMAMEITPILADLAARTFATMINGMTVSDVIRIVERIYYSECKTGVRMIQVMFFLRGYEDVALALDILQASEEFVEEIYEWFFDDLYDTSIFKCYLFELDLCDESELEDDPGYDEWE